VIDTQPPPITSGIVLTPGMREALAEAGIALEAALVRDIQTGPSAGDVPRHVAAGRVVVTRERAR
jgi:hypothetical protein